MRRWTRRRLASSIRAPWSYWNSKMGRYPAPPLPRRRSRSVGRCRSGGGGCRARSPLAWRGRCLGVASSRILNTEGRARTRRPQEFERLRLLWPLCPRSALRVKRYLLLRGGELASSPLRPIKYLIPLGAQDGGRIGTAGPTVVRSRAAGSRHSGMGQGGPVASASRMGRPVVRR